MKFPIYVLFGLIAVMFVMACSYWWKQRKAPDQVDPTCEMLEQHMTEMDCQEYVIIAGPDQTIGTIDDMTFSQLCTYIEESGVMKPDMQCIMLSKTCEEVGRCLHVYN